MNGERYEGVLVRGFENKIKTRDGFRRIVKKHFQKEQEEELYRKVKIIVETIKAINGDNANNITEIVKTVLDTFEVKK